MSEEPLTPDGLLDKIANLEGQTAASRVMTAMLFYALRTETPVELVNGYTRRLSESLGEQMHTFFPEHREAFSAGIRDGLVSIQVIASVINNFMDEMGHSAPPDE